MSIDLESLSSDDRKRWDGWMASTKQALQEIDDIKESLRDSTKGLAEEFGYKPKELMMAARTAYKDDLAAKQESMDAMLGILSITGHG